jgi:carotenoid cleavage dioxygenase-like enzyme
LEVVVIDAKTRASEPVAVVSLPSRVNGGFHSIFVPQIYITLNHHLLLVE